LNYGSRQEIINAVQTIAAKMDSGEIAAHEISEETIAAALETADMPDPDLLIRTSGEYRISNFLLWQISYTELWITPTMWPDFREKDLIQAIQDYSQRERRYGKVKK